MLVAILVWVSLFTNGLLFVAWSKHPWIDLLIKFGLGCLTALCLIILVQTNGFSGVELK